MTSRTTIEAWAGILIGRLTYFVVVALLASAISFLILDVLPGSGVDHLLTENSSQEDVDALIDQAGLDDPVHVRFGNWLSGVVTGDFGESSVTGQKVGEILSDKAPITLALILISQVGALVLAIALALFASAPRVGAIRSTMSAFLLVILAVPHFVWAVLLIVGVASVVNFIPTSGYVPLSSHPTEWLGSIALPVMTLALIEVPMLCRLLIEELQVLQQRTFTEYSRSLGYSELYILTRQCLPVALVPTVTVFAMNLGSLISGAVIVETIFAIPGIGRAMFTAISQKDYMLVQGCVMVSVGVYVMANMAASTYNAVAVKEQGRQE